MAQDPDKPLDDGRVRMPPVDSAMNKTMPMSRQPRGQRGEKKPVALRPGDPKKGDTKKERDEKLLARARKRFDLCMTAESDSRKHGLDDLKFKSGEGQWPADVVADRNFDKRPCLTINKLPTFVNQVVNDQRMNRPAIDINPVGDKGDPEVAKMYRGLIRAIERQSQADIAYDTGFDSAVSIGWGYWRVMLEYESPDTFQQAITIRRVRNTFTVYLDPMHQEPDGSDAKYAFVTELVSRKEFEEEWPDADPMPWRDGGVGEEYKEWIMKDEIRIAEYYEIENEKRRLVRLANFYEGWWDELPDEVKDSTDPQYEIVEERWSDCPKVMWRKLTATSVLQEQEWVGKWIPIVRCIGNEIDIQGKLRLSGLIRNAKSPQLMYNYHRLISLDEPIPGPDGWEQMRDIHAGCRVFDESGRVCNVVGESPVHINLPCYRVEFSDGTSIVTDATHQWRVEERGKRKAATWDWSTKTISTSELRPRIHYIERTKPLDLPDADLPVDPYVLGVWLGDGTSCAAEITQAASDIEELRSHVASCGYNVGPTRQSAGGRAPKFTVHGLAAGLRAAGVFRDKHIPLTYLRASAPQRLALLQGLMDTDGHARRSRQCAFVTTNNRLAIGFAELLRTLGVHAKAYRREAYTRKWADGRVSECQDAAQFNFTASAGQQVFRLSRKLARLSLIRIEHSRRTMRHGIVSVERVASVPVKCIAVDSPSHLFLAGEGMVPTHNTLSVELSSLQPKAPWIMEEGQVEGHEQEWKQANVKTLPYLLYKGTSINGKNAPPPQRQPFAGAPAGVLAEVQAAAQDMMAVTGIRFDATLGERVYDESGRALREIRERGDLGSFHYIDNFARSLRHTGEILVDLIPKVYERKCMLTILREDDSEETIQVDPNAPKPFQEGRNPVTQKGMKIFNPTFGRYGVTVTIGPSFATKRIESAESMMDFVRALGPQIAPNVADLIAKNMDWPGAQEMATRLAKMLPPNLLAPEMKDVPPQVQAMIGQLQQQVQALNNEKMQLTAALTNQQADRAQRQDEIEKSFEAKLLATIAGFEAKMAATQQKQDQAMIDRVGAPIEELARGVAELRASMEQPKQGNGLDA